MVVLREAVFWYVMAAIRLCCSCCVSQERRNVSAVPTLLESSSGLLAHTLSIPGSAGSVNSETTGSANRVSDTLGSLTLS